MAPLSWAQVAATNFKPEPLRHKISADILPQTLNPSPTPSSAILTDADFPSLTKEEEDRRERQKCTTLAVSHNGILCSTSGSSRESEANGKVGLAPSFSEEGSRPHSTLTSPISPSTAPVATAANKANVMSPHGRERNAATKATEESAQQTRLPNSLESIAAVFSVSTETSAEINATTSVAVPLLCEKKVEELAMPSDEEDTGGDSTEASAQVEEATAAGLTGDSDHRGVFWASLERGRLPLFEKDRRVSLFYANETYDCAITLKDGKTVGAHREILVSESTYLAQNLPAPNEASHHYLHGITHYKLNDYTIDMISVVIFFMYMGELGGHKLEKANMWNSQYILNNVMFYRPATLLGVNSMMKWQVNNILEAGDFLRDALSSRFFYYKLTSAEKLAGFEMPLRMAHIHLYAENTEKEFEGEIREMKIALAKLALVVLPFLRRQTVSVDQLQTFWETLPFPWRSEMEEFRHEGLLPDFPNCFEDNLQWVEEKGDHDQIQVQEDDSGSSSASNMPYSQSSIQEMARRLAMAGFDTGYHV